jgi:hypothetical protein
LAQLQTQFFFIVHTDQLQQLKVMETLAVAAQEQRIEAAEAAVQAELLQEIMVEQQLG